MHTFKIVTTNFQCSITNRTCFAAEWFANLKNKKCQYIYFIFITLPEVRLVWKSWKVSNNAYFRFRKAFFLTIRDSTDFLCKEKELFGVQTISPHFNSFGAFLCRICILLRLWNLSGTHFFWMTRLCGADFCKDVWRLVADLSISSDKLRNIIGINLFIWIAKDA